MAADRRRRRALPRGGGRHARGVARAGEVLGARAARTRIRDVYPSAGAIPVASKENHGAD